MPTINQGCDRYGGKLSRHSSYTQGSYHLIGKTDKQAKIITYNNNEQNIFSIEHYARVLWKQMGRAFKQSEVRRKHFPQGEK